MLSEYKAGTVAMAIRADGPEFLVVRTRGGEAGDYWSAPKGWPAGVPLHDIQGYRPLVVLDPEDAEQINRLVCAFEDAWGGCAGGMATALREALRSLTNPPKPAEPTVRGAVVKDAKGLEWVRVHPAGEAWVNGYQQWATWDDIDAVEVVRP